MGATVNVDGACSFIFDQAGLRTPVADLGLPGLLKRTRLEVDGLHGVYTRTTDRRRAGPPRIAEVRQRRIQRNLHRHGARRVVSPVAERRIDGDATYGLAN